MKKDEKNELQRLEEEAQQSLELGEQTLDSNIESNENLTLGEKVFDNPAEYEESDEEDDSVDSSNASSTGNQSQSKIPFGIVPDISRKEMSYYGVNGYVGKVSDFLEVVNVIKNLDTQKLRVTLHHVSLNFNTEFTVEASTLKRSEIFDTLIHHGVIVHQWGAPVLSQYLIEQIDEFTMLQKLVYQHEKLGWSDASNKEKGFFAANSIGAPYSSIIRGNDECILGKYGDRATYDEMIQKEVIPNQSLHLPFVLAFTAPIVPLMYKKSACPVIMMNFAGKSSHGKTTSLILMASVWGRGVVSNNRLSVIKSFASTQNGLEAAVNANNGVPIMFDDYEAAAQNIGFRQLIYRLTAGQSTVRLGKGFHPKDTFEWQTTLAFSGESSLFDRAGENLGLKARVIEFKNKAWTISKENSIAITSTASSHYGFYGEEFVSGLLKYTDEDLEKLYDESSEVINEKLPDSDNIADRIQTRLTLVRMTAELVKKILNLAIDVDYITEELVSNELKRQADFTIYEKAKERLIEYTTANLSRFVKTDKEYCDTTIPTNLIDGRIYSGDKGYFVAFLPKTFNNILSEFNDKEAILEKWVNEGFLIPDKDGKHLSKPTRITSFNQASRCYVVMFEDNDGLLSGLLNESDTVNPQDIVNEDKIIRMSKGKEAPATISYMGKQYKLCEPNPEYKEKDEKIGNPRREAMKPDFPKIASPQTSGTPISEIKYDDTKQIDEMFAEEDNND